MRRVAIQQLRADGIGLILEWDEDTEKVALAQAARSGEERDQAYDRLIALQRAMRSQGVGWVDVELTERHRPVCGVRALALVWRAEMRSDGGARQVAEVVKWGLTRGRSGEVE